MPRTERSGPIARRQVLLRFDDERRWLRAAPKQAGHLFPGLLCQSECNDRVKNLTPLMEAALRWLAEATPGSAELARLMDANPGPARVRGWRSAAAADGVQRQGSRRPDGAVH